MREYLSVIDGLPFEHIGYWIVLFLIYSFFAGSVGYVILLAKYEFQNTKITKEELREIVGRFFFYEILAGLIFFFGFVSLIQ